jgi:hypothetical protein
MKGYRVHGSSSQVLRHVQVWSMQLCSQVQQHAGHPHLRRLSRPVMMPQANGKLSMMPSSQQSRCQSML